MSIGEEYELLIPDTATMEEQERTMIQAIAENIVAVLTLLGDFPFVMEFEERDLARTTATWSMIFFRRPNDEAKIAMSTMSPKSAIIFETKGQQEYEAENLKDADENYTGKITVSVRLRAVYDDVKGCFTQDEPLASTLLRLGFAHYYEEILRFYPEWKTNYKNAPTYVALPAD